jgi:hypothetical protein
MFSHGVPQRRVDGKAVVAATDKDLFFPMPVEADKLPMDRGPLALSILI